MTIYNKEEWLEKHENKAIEAAIALPEETEMDMINFRQALGDIFYMRNRFFVDGVSEEGLCQFVNTLNRGQ